jgi:hypothetical protein
MKLFGSSTQQQRRPPAPQLRLVTTPPPARLRAVPTAELAECNCPDFCERDHENE